MSVVCNRMGGVALRIDDGEGRLKRVKLALGENDLDPQLVIDALSRMDPAMAQALTTGDPPALAVGGYVAADPPIEMKGETVKAPPPPAPPVEKIGAADKAKMARNASTLQELRQLAEGEERKTVTDAIDKRAAELELEEG